MTKKMITAKPGVLTKLLEERGHTQTHLSEITGFDRKTLRAIDKGDRVKDTTLQRLAVKLNIPFSFIAISNDEADETSSEAGGQSDLVVSKTSSTILRDQLAGCHSVEWRLQIDDVSDVEEKYLKQFDFDVEMLRTRLSVIGNHSDYDGEHPSSLSFQLSLIKNWKSLDTILSELGDRGIGIFSGNYLYWSRSSFRKTGGCQFTSVKKLLLLAAKSSVHTLRVPVDPGEPPPDDPNELKNIEGSVYVNGHLVRSKYDDLDDDIPF